MAVWVAASEVQKLPTHLTRSCECAARKELRRNHISIDAAKPIRKPALSLPPSVFDAVPLGNHASLPRPSFGREFGKPQ